VAMDISKECVLSQSLRGDGENWVRLIALQNRKFKLIYDAGSEANNEYYNLGSDPDEKDNLINNKSYSKEINEFTGIIKEFLKINSHTSKLKEKIKELKESMKI
jgi:hypothetical protein